MSIVSTFPLFKLPILCIEDVLIQCHTLDLLYLSLLSKKCHRIVQSLNNPFDGLYIKVANNETLVQIGYGNVCKGKWHFNCDDIGKNEEIIRSIGGCKMKTCIKGIHFYSYVDENIQMSVKAGIQYLMDLFKLPIVRIDLYSDDYPQSSSLLIGFSECKELQIIGENEMDHDEIRNICEQFKCTEFLLFDIPIDDSFSCDGMKSKRVTFKNGAKWVKLQQLFDWKFVTLKLIPSSLQPKELELFVTNWFQSNQTNFEYLAVIWDQNIGEFNFDSLPLMPWSENRRSHAYKYHKNSAKDCSKGMDIKREDGLLATILIQPKLFFFCVWHDRFHDVTGLNVH